MVDDSYSGVVAMHIVRRCVRPVGRGNRCCARTPRATIHASRDLLHLQTRDANRIVHMHIHIHVRAGWQQSDAGHLMTLPAKPDPSEDQQAPEEGSTVRRHATADHVVIVAGFRFEAASAHWFGLRPPNQRGARLCWAERLGETSIRGAGYGTTQIAVLTPEGGSGEGRSCCHAGRPRR